MDQILDQLGGLVLGAVPTMVFFILLVVAYGLLVRRPLDKVLAERRVRTTGAMEQAREALTAAEAETSVYEDKLRRAKAEIFSEREARLKNWNAQRDQAIEEARSATADRVNRAKLEIEQSVAAARRQIENVGAELSDQVLRAVLPAGARSEAIQ